MRTSFVSVAGLLGAGTLPICLLISGAAVPVLGFAYGTPWVPAAHALVWLAMLAALRILFELVYDFFVVLAQARVVFTVQAVWFVALVPALIAGAWAGGIAGAGLAEVAVAVCVVLPWYLAELSRVGITRRTLAARLWLPFTAAVAVGAAAAVAARLIPNDLASLSASGVVALAVIGLLGYWMRRPLAALRADFRQRPAPSPAAAAALAATTPAPAGHTVLVGAPGPTASAPDWRAAAEPARAPRGWASLRDVAPGVSGALPVSQGELAPALTVQDLTGPLPIYRETVATLRWDPASTQPGDTRDRRTD